MSKDALAALLVLVILLLGYAGGYKLATITATTNCEQAERRP